MGRVMGPTVERPTDLQIASYVASLEDALAEARALVPVNSGDVDAVRPWLAQVLDDAAGG